MTFTYVKTDYSEVYTFVCETCISFDNKGKLDPTLAFFGMPNVILKKIAESENVEVTDHEATKKTGKFLSADVLDFLCNLEMYGVSGPPLRE
jgi:hypothetical protein